jgi:putative polyhydroxyalkanoate system protein
MSEIDIRRRHALGMEDARRLAGDMAQRLQQRFGLACRWEGDTVHFERDGVRGCLTLAPGEIRIHARLGFLLSLAGSHIEDEISAQLERVLGPASVAHEGGLQPGSERV